MGPLEKSPAPGEHEAPFFDGSRLTELRECFADAELRALLRGIAEEGAESLGQIHAALAANDLAAAQRAAHRLKGLASNLGATRLAEAARRTELAAQLCGDVPSAVRRLSDVLAETEKNICLVA